MRSIMYFFVLAVVVLMGGRIDAQIESPSQPSTYQWVSLESPRAMERAIPFGSSAVGASADSRQETAVARGKLRLGQSEVPNALGETDGIRCVTLMVDARQQRSRELELSETQLLIAREGYQAEWMDIDESRLRGMTDSEVEELGGVRLESMLAGQGNFRGFIARYENRDKTHTPGLYARLAHLPGDQPCRFIQLRAQESDGTLQLLVIKRGSNSASSEKIR
ncbi:MAG: hypothetical protein KDB22_09830 [Planctomycetales bacterium]|nr:hypothetical protein [Planctomycetales bacterium]